MNTWKDPCIKQEPRTDVSTGRESREDAGRWGVSDLYASVLPIKIERGMMMKRSM
jgi:hypothetical protein